MPYNRVAHEYMLSQGYSYNHYEARMGDDGGPENGPHFWYIPAFDEYVIGAADRENGMDESVIIDEDGQTSRDFVPAYLNDIPF